MDDGDTLVHVNGTFEPLGVTATSPIHTGGGLVAMFAFCVCIQVSRTVFENCWRVAFCACRTCEENGTLFEGVSVIAYMFPFRYVHGGHSQRLQLGIPSTFSSAFGFS